MNDAELVAQAFPDGIPTDEQYGSNQPYPPGMDPNDPNSTIPNAKTSTGAFIERLGPETANDPYNEPVTAPDSYS
ncbi:MAG TPA: hypothetical protein VM754_04790 [Actinomycetota bacterium]|nr:hypothetical protein [Actinomycetota bacterium]